MRNFLNAGNRGNKKKEWVTTKSISIMILLPLLPLLPLYTSSRDSWNFLCVYAQNILASLTPICTKRVTWVTRVTSGLQITIFLLPFIQNRGNKRVTPGVTGRPTQ